MPAPTGVKQPQDRRRKTHEAEPDVKANADRDTLTMTIGGVDYESLPLSEVFTGGWFRRNRNLDELDGFYQMIEDAFDGVEGFLEAWDALSLTRQRELHAGMQEAMQVSLGESSRSST